MKGMVGLFSIKKKYHAVVKFESEGLFYAIKNDTIELKYEDGVSIFWWKLNISFPQWQ